uniref:DUF834 domain-containing protein n=1 Tax=Oryza glumipatula TaxID=40148 RepID=A0A0D9YRX2_9ORYZ
MVDPAAPPSRGLDPTPLAPEWVTAELEGGGSGSAALRRGGSAILSPGQQQQSSRAVDPAVPPSASREAMATTEIEGSRSGGTVLGPRRGVGDGGVQGQRIQQRHPQP